MDTQPLRLINHLGSRCPLSHPIAGILDAAPTAGQIAFAFVARGLS
jgi:hypothetical protein